MIRPFALNHWAPIAALARRALDFVLPPVCLACREPIADPGRLCPACFADAKFLADPLCRVCGLAMPLAAPVSGIADVDLTCARCLADPPPYARARSVLLFDDVARRLVHDFKYHDRLEGRRAFGAWMARVGAPFLAEADLLAPVPLHRTRLILRRYNQAALLASAVAEATGRPHVPDLLVRKRRTRRQVGLTSEERRANVRGAFAVRAGRASLVKDAHIVLVDDVLTTGATVEASALALVKAGAREVTVLTLARAPGPS